jgi:hypothetical protein
MTYQQLHRLMLVVACCAGITGAVWTAFFFGVVLQAGIVVVVMELLWIGWELHRVASLARDFVLDYVEQDIQAKDG